MIHFSHFCDDQLNAEYCANLVSIMRTSANTACTEMTKLYCSLGIWVMVVGLAEMARVLITDHK